MNGLGEVIIGIINFIGFLLFLFGALITSWEGLGLVVLLLAYFLGKGNEISTSSFLIAYLVWLGFGYLIGVSNTLFSSVTAKILLLTFISSLVIVLKRGVLQPHYS